MGGMQRWLEEIEARGWSDVEKHVCTDCVLDSYLIEAIRNTGGSDRCDYCGETPATPSASADVAVILELIVEGFRSEYEDPVEQVLWSSADGGYQIATQDTHDLLFEHETTDNEALTDDLAAAIRQQEWVDRDPYALSPSDALRHGWASFRDYVKHHRRYTFLLAGASRYPDPGEITLNKIPSAVLDAVSTADQIRVLSTGTRWWRLRPHPAGETYSSGKELGSPPAKVARDNRMSGKGIGAFYGASTSAGAIREVAGYADADQAGTLGSFIQLKEIAVVDLTQPIPVPSLFDPDLAYLRPSARFMHDFIADVSRIADPTDSLDLDYVPTQIIAEFFRYELKLPHGEIGGVVWRSSKDRDVECCVLFAANELMTESANAATGCVLALDEATVQRVQAPLNAAL